MKNKNYVRLNSIITILQSLITITIFLMACQPSYGQNGVDSLDVGLVKDINQGSSGSLLSSPTDVNGTLFFAATDGQYGNELWMSDGTTAGTQLVKDINPNGDSLPRELTVLNGVLFFEADDGENGSELWRSDGTESGTQLVADINPNGDSDPGGLTVSNGTLFFAATDTSDGRELWKTDGTETGTELVKNIYTNGDSNPADLINVEETLFFSADDGTNGEELWKSDGTESGTQVVANINPNSGDGSNPRFLESVNGTLFFQANNGSDGTELWVSDGTDTGTQLVRDINSGGDAFPRNLTNVNGTLFFSADDGNSGTELWKSDGTEAGTQLVKDINSFSFSTPDGLTAVGNTLYFSADDGVNGRELWKSDGTENGTKLVKDINPGLIGSLATSSAGNFETELFNFNQTLIFRADDGTNGAELWRSDGTESGTTLIQDIKPGAEGSVPQLFTALDDVLFFRASDGTNGDELWKGESEIQNLISCPDVQLASGSGLPMDKIALSGLPGELIEPLAAEVTASGTDSSAFAFAVRDTFLVPFYPGVKKEGGSVSLRFRGTNQRCSNTISFTIDPLPDESGETQAVVDSLDNFIEFKIGLVGVDQDELRNTSIENLPEILRPLAIAQRSLDNIRSDISSLQKSGQSDSRLQQFEPNMDFTDYILKRTEVRLLPDAIRDAMRPILEQREQTLENNNCFPENITTAEDLSFCMNLEQQGNFFFSVGNLREQIPGATLKRAFDEISADAVTMASMHPDTRVGLAIAILRTAHLANKAPFKIAPNGFSDIDFDVSTTNFNEDDTEPGEWSNATVRAEGSGWGLNEEILDVLLTFDPTGAAVDAFTIEPHLNEYATEAFRDLKQQAFNDLVQQTTGREEIGIPAAVTPPIDISDQMWSVVDADGLEIINRTEYLPAPPFPPSQAELAISTRDSQFPTSITGVRSIAVEAIDPVYSTITNTATGNIVPKDPVPSGCPGTNPVTLEPNAEYQIKVTTFNAINPRVEIASTVGEIISQSFERLTESSGETTVIFKAPRKTAPYLTYISAESISQTGLRALPEAPVRRENLSIQIGETEISSDCEPPPLSEVAGDGNGGGIGGGASESTIPSGGVYGHPHFINFKGAGFDFQAVGEFILAKSNRQDEDFEVQLRLEPISGMFVNLTIATAVAMDVAGDRVVLVSGEDQPLKVNGSPATVSRGNPLELSQGGIIYRTARSYTIDWPSGNHRVETLIDPDAATPRLPNVHFFTKAESVTQAQDSLDGLIGGFQTRNSEVIDPGSFRELYRVYGNDWRISQEESLFGTPTFSDPDFPQQQFTIDQLSAQRREDARQICEDAGVSNPMLLNNCILDVATTQDPELANDVVNLTIAPPDTFITTGTPFPAPVNLRASLRDSVIDLTWNSVQDSALARYRIYRDTTSLSGTPANFTPIDSVASVDSSYTDRDIKGGETYFYRVTALDSSGTESEFSREAEVSTTSTSITDKDKTELPEQITLEGNYPNPFNPSTTIRFGLRDASYVSLKVYNILGRQVATLVDDQITAGWHEVRWDAGRNASGVYIAVLDHRDRRISHQMLLIK